MRIGSSPCIGIKLKAIDIACEICESSARRLVGAAWHKYACDASASICAKVISIRMFKMRLGYARRAIGTSVCMKHITCRHGFAVKDFVHAWLCHGHSVWDCVDRQI